MEVDRIGENLVKDLENSLPSLLVAINDIFLKLEASIGHFHAHRQVSDTLDNHFFVLLVTLLHCKALSYISFPCNFVV